MVELRVTHYDPRLRGEIGEFLGDSWTSISHIGRVFEGTALTPESYLAAEDAHVEAVESLMRAAGVWLLRVGDIEFHDYENHGIGDESGLKRVHEEVQNGRDALSGLDLGRFVRLCLRECAWCLLSGAGGFYVHFGYDYYVYIGGTDHSFEVPDAPAGLFFEEEFRSPYWPDPDE